MRDIPGRECIFTRVKVRMLRVKAKHRVARRSKGHIAVSGKLHLRHNMNAHLHWPEHYPGYCASCNEDKQYSKAQQANQRQPAAPGRSRSDLISARRNIIPVE